MVATDRLGPRDGRWDISSDTTSYIDDGCPTVWRGSAQEMDQSQIPAKGTSSNRQEDVSTPRSTTRVKPIDGDLLQRLFRATMDEKRRIAEETRAQAMALRDTENVVESKSRRSGKKPGGLYIPDHLKRGGEDSKRRHREEVDGRAEEAPVKTTPRVITAEIREIPQRSAKEKKDLKKASKNTGPDGIEPLRHDNQEAYVDLPLPHVEDEIDVVNADPDISLVEDEQLLEPATEEQDLTSGPTKDNKKGKKKRKKQQNAAQRADRDAADAIMSGALLAEDDVPVVVENNDMSQRSGRASSASFVAAFDTPRREEARPRSHKSSSTSSKPSRAESSPARKASSTTATSVRVESEKAASFALFEEVGQGWIGNPFAKDESTASRTKSMSKGSAQFTVQQSDASKGPTCRSPRATRSEARDQNGSAKRPGSDVQGWEEIAQPIARSRSEVHGGWRAGSGNRHHARSVRSLEGAATDWNESHAERPSKGLRPSIHSRLVSIDGGKAVALDWGEESPGRSRSSKTAAKNLFNIPILGDVEPAKLASAQARSKGSDDKLSPEQPRAQHVRGSTRSGASRRSVEIASQDRSHHGPQSASAHDLEEMGGGWYQVPLEVGRSYVSRSRSQSRVRTSVSYRISQDAESVHQARSPSKHSKDGSATEAHRQHDKWTQYDRDECQIAGSAYSAQPSVHELADTSQSSKSIQERNACRSEHSKQATVRSAYGWENHPRHISVAKSAAQGSYRQATASGRLSTVEAAGAYDKVEEAEHDRKQTAWSGIKSDQAASRHSQPSNPRVHPTIFAGKGWISPHPLSEAPSAVASPPQSRIVLPEEAYPYGATMTYEEWRELQERGMRSHRNFSQTESDQTRRGKRHHGRYKFAGWEAKSSDESRLEQEGSRRSGSGQSRSKRSTSTRDGLANSYRAPTVTSEQSSAALFSDEQPRTITSDMLKDDRSVHESHASSKPRSLLSRIRTLTSWSQHHSGSKQAYDGSEGTHSSRRSSGRSEARQHPQRHSSHWHSHLSSEHDSGSHSSPRHSHRSSRHESGHRSKHSSEHRSRHSSDRHSRQTSGRESRHSSSVQEREMEVMEEGRNLWSENPEYDGTASNAEQSGWKAPSEDLSHTATSQLYLHRYRAEEASSNGYES